MARKLRASPRYKSLFNLTPPAPSPTQRGGRREKEKYLSFIRSTSLLILSALLPLVAAEVSVNLTGAITDKATDKPIANATVRLAIAKATATTDTSGMYTLAGSFAGVCEKYTRGSVAMAPSVHRGAVLFSVTNGMRRVIAELFDLQGRLVERLMDKPCGPGSYRLTPAGRIAGQALCLRLRIAEQATVLRFVAGGGSGGFEQVSEVHTTRMAKNMAVVDTLVISATNYVTKRVVVESYSGQKDAALAVANMKNVIIFNIQPAESAGIAIAQVTGPSIDTLRDSLSWRASDKAFAGRIGFPTVNDAVLRVLIYSKGGRLATTITAPQNNDTAGTTATLPFNPFTALRDTFVRIDSPLVLTPDFGSMQYSGKYYWDIGNDGWDDSTATPQWTFKRHADGPVKVTVGVRLENGVFAGVTAEVFCWMPVKAFAAGMYHTMILKQDNSLWACGRNDLGQLGDGTITNRLTPVLIMTGVLSMAAGWWHTMILKQDNSLWACGWDGSGQPGNGTITNRSTPALIMTGVQSVTEGEWHTMILKQDNSLWACRANVVGQLGDGTTTYRSTPVLIMTGVQSTAAGIYHTMILKQDNSLWACGENKYGQLGDGTIINSLKPVLIMTGVKSVAAGGEHTMILKQDNSLWACGRNDFGSLGDGTTTDRLKPVLIMTGVQSVAAKMYHTMILKQDNSLWACGINDKGQLGDGTITNRFKPVLIMTGVQSVTTGGEYTMILKQDNSLWACGWNNFGQLGDGTNPFRLTPVWIMF
jgi:alpha-tubulin suppressor-like RCC1 family protein